MPATRKAISTGADEFEDFAATGLAAGGGNVAGGGGDGATGPGPSAAAAAAGGRVEVGFGVTIVGATAEGETC